MTRLQASSRRHLRQAPVPGAAAGGGSSTRARRSRRGRAAGGRCCGSLGSRTAPSRGCTPSRRAAAAPGSADERWPVQGEVQACEQQTCLRAMERCGMWAVVAREVCEFGGSSPVAYADVEHLHESIFTVDGQRGLLVRLPRCSGRRRCGRARPSVASQAPRYRCARHFQPLPRRREVADKLLDGNAVFSAAGLVGARRASPLCRQDGAKLPRPPTQRLVREHLRPPTPWTTPARCAPRSWAASTTIGSCARRRRSTPRTAPLP